MLNLPIEEKGKILPLHEKVECAVPDKHGRFSVVEKLVPNEGFVYVCRPSGHFLQFLHDLYLALARTVEERDKWEGTPRSWKTKRCLQQYRSLKPFFNTQEGTFAFPVAFQDKMPSCLRIPHLVLEQDDAYRVVLEHLWYH